MIGKTISHYKILEKLGGGGMGVVYKAEDLKLKRMVALKFLPHHVSANEEDKKRFIHEATAASAIDHPNICTIHDIDETSKGQLFLCMAYYDGETLKKKISRGPIKINDAVDYAIQIARGLIQAHDREIVHRDIKPANIIITNFAEAKIVDFGLAKFVGQTSLTKENSIMGTVAYMSPEQTRGDKIDHRTDIWSLGIVLYEMISGVCPFLGEYEQAMIYSILNEEPKSLSELRAGVTPKLSWIVEKAIAKNQDDRFQHVDEFLVNLLEFEKNPQSEAIQIFGKSKPVSSIAVLPFTDMSQDHDQEYFCDGMAEELINTLTKIDGLRVTSRTSAFQFKEKSQDIRGIGEQLNVKTILEGSVRKAENKLRITAQLVKSIDGFQLWSEKFEREMKDIFAIQDEISEAIVGALKPKLSGESATPAVKRYTENIEAYNRYLQGRYYWSKRTEQGLNKGIELFQEAIQLEPNYALAYAGLADSFIILGSYGDLPQAMSIPKARDATLTALKIDESLAEAHTSMGCIRSIYDWDWQQAERDFQKAQELNSNYAPAHHWYAINNLTPQKRFEEAFSHIKKARDLDPLSLFIHASVGLQFYFSKQYEIAIEQFLKTIDMEPNFGIAHFFLGQAALQTGKLEQAYSSFEKAVELHGGTTNLLAALAHLFAIRGDKIEAEDRLKDLLKQKRYVSAYDIAVIYTGLENIDLAFEWLEKAYMERSFLLIYLTVDPKLARLHSDERFYKLAGKIGLEV